MTVAPTYSASIALPDSPRYANYREAHFLVRHAFSLGSHDYQHVALIDDIVTTGATARELTRRLKHSGVKKVEVWAICRTLRDAV